MGSEIGWRFWMFSYGRICVIIVNEEVFGVKQAKRIPAITFGESGAGRKLKPHSHTLGAVLECDSLSSRFSSFILLIHLQSCCD